MPDALRQYVDRFRGLANQLIAARWLSPPELIELNACMMLVAIAQRLGDCEADLFDEGWLNQIKRAIAEMRDDMRADRDAAVGAVSRWN